MLSNTAPWLHRFVGRLVGKALHDGQLIDAYFTRTFYKHMLGQVGCWCATLMRKRSLH
jgi:hypothetical protein